MTTPNNTPQYPASSTGLLLVDPYNDFLSDGGKLHARAKAVAEQVGTLVNLRKVVAAVRAGGDPGVLHTTPPFSP